MKIFKKIALILAVLFVFQVTPMSVIANSFNDPLDDTSRGISVLANYVKEDVGRAGTLYVNEYNQEVIIERTDLLLASESSQFELLWYYNSYDNGFSTNSPYGNHWKSNYDISLKYDNETNKFIYLHNDGAVVSFSKTPETKEGYTCWQEDISIMCRLDKLYVKNNSISPADARIETIMGETLTFDSSGKLVSISSDDYSINIEHNDYGISKIIDNIGRYYQLSYNSHNQVNLIVCYDENKNKVYIEDECETVAYRTQYHYDKSGNLVSVSYPDGKAVFYEYEAPHKLSTIKSVDGKHLEISYSRNRAAIVNQIANDDLYKSREIVSLKAEENGTVVKTELFKKTKYTYNSYGLLVYDNSFIGKVDKEVKAVDKADEKANAERINPCDCADCYLVSCDCKCENRTNCNCFSCNISASISSAQKRTNSLSADNTIVEKNKNDQNSYFNSLGRITEMSNSVGTKTKYSYDINQNIRKVTLELAGLTDNIIENSYSYDNDKLVSIASNNTKYDFFYDKWGNVSGVDIAGEDYVRYQYVDGNINYTQTQEYGNGQTLTYSYNDNGSISSVSLDNGKTSAFEYEYYQNDDIKIKNHINNTDVILTAYTYEIYDSKNNEKIFSIENNHGRNYILKLGNDAYDITWQYVYNRENGIYSVQLITKGKNTSATVNVIRDENEVNLATSVSTSNNDNI